MNYSRFPFRRRRRMTVGTAVVVLLMAIAGVIYDRYYRADKHNTGDWAAYDRQVALVISVADGDTLTIRPLDGDPDAKVRMLGIDAPELRDENGKPAYWSERARDYLRSKALQKQVTIQLERTKSRDKYGRLLAYVYGEDMTHLNLDLVQQGHVYADTRFSHSMKPQFEQAEGQARRGKKGLWKSVAESQMPPWRQKWLKERRGTPQ